MACGRKVWAWLSTGLITLPLIQLQLDLDVEHEAAKQALIAGKKVGTNVISRTCTHIYIYIRTTYFLITCFTQSKALTSLRQRKFQESLLVKTDVQLETITNLVRTLVFEICLICFHGQLTT